jgi:hypothetical protein
VVWCAARTQVQHAQRKGHLGERAVCACRLSSHPSDQAARPWLAHGQSGRHPPHVNRCVRRHRCRTNADHQPVVVPTSSPHRPHIVHEPTSPQQELETETTNVPLDRWTLRLRSMPHTLRSSHTRATRPRRACVVTHYRPPAPLPYPTSPLPHPTYPTTRVTIYTHSSSCTMYPRVARQAASRLLQLDVGAAQTRCHQGRHRPQEPRLWPCPRRGLRAPSHAHTPHTYPTLTPHLPPYPTLTPHLPHTRRARCRSRPPAGTPPHDPSLRGTPHTLVARTLVDLSLRGTHTCEAARSPLCPPLMK